MQQIRTARKLRLLGLVLLLGTPASAQDLTLRRRARQRHRKIPIPSLCLRARGFPCKWRMPSQHAMPSQGILCFFETLVRLCGTTESSSPPGRLSTERL